MQYPSTSVVVIHYEEALYQVYGLYLWLLLVLDFYRPDALPVIHPTVPNKSRGNYGHSYCRIYANMKLCTHLMAIFQD